MKEIVWYSPELNIIVIQKVLFPQLDFESDCLNVRDIHSSYESWMDGAIQPTLWVYLGEL